MTNKFEHLMTAKNHEEIDKEGRTEVTQYSKAWNRNTHVATINKYVSVKMPYSIAKKILSDSGYCHKRRISKSDYNAKNKTIILTGLYPITKIKFLTDECEVIKEYYTYEV